MQFDLLVYYKRGLKSLSPSLDGNLKNEVDGVLPADYVWPMVTVQLPLYNEQYVVERLIDTIAAFDYPKDRFEIHI